MTARNLFLLSINLQGVLLGIMAFAETWVMVLPICHAVVALGICVELAAEKNFGVS